MFLEQRTQRIGYHQNNALLGRQRTADRKQGKQDEQQAEDT